METLLELVVWLSWLVIMWIGLSMLLEPVKLKLNYNHMTKIGVKTREELFREFRDKEVE